MYVLVNRACSDKSANSNYSLHLNFVKLENVLQNGIDVVQRDKFSYVPHRRVKR